MTTKIRSVLMIVALSYIAADAPKAHAVVPPPDGGYPNFTTAEGTNALKNLTTGAANTAVGWFSLFGDTTASFNTGVGAGTLLFNNGDQNTAVGVAALLSNTTGSFDTATGVSALSSNTTGVSNTALGWGALLSNTTGNNNTAIGVRALQSNTEGAANVAVGETALSDNTAGTNNTAIGVNALHNNSAAFNTALGYSAGSNVTGSGNVCIGAGVAGVAGENNTIRIGDNLPAVAGQSACYIGGIANQAVTVAAPVAIDTTTGKLGTVQTSSRRFKRDIKPMDEASEAILALKPVTFHFNNDAKNTPCFGLIAEDVAKVDPGLVTRDQNGEIYGVRYDQVNAMLLNEFLKEHRKVQKLEAALDAVTARLKEQETELQKVTAQIQMNKPARRVASTE